MAKTQKTARTDRTPKTHRTARTGLLMFMGVMVILGVLGARSPLASTNDYYYTTPKTTNIFGRVMGENGDYKLVRAEDLAFINEAWAERAALAGSAGETNATAEGTLVEGRSRRTSNNRYWNRAPLRECVLTNSAINALTEASGGAMTNITCAITNAAAHKLVTMGWLTNNFATLKKMNCMVVQPNVSSDDETVTTTAGHHVKRTQWQGQGEWDKIEWDDDPTTNRQTLAALQMIEKGYGKYEMDSDLTQSNIEETFVEKEVTDGSGTLRLSFEVADTNAWLRGQDSPKVVRSARVWLKYELYARSLDQEEEYYPDRRTVRDEETHTNVTALVDLGAPRWAGVVTNSLTYELEVDVRELYGKFVDVAPFMPSLAEIEAAAAVPSVSASYGYAMKEKYMYRSGYPVFYLVLDLKPVASVEGW